MGTLLIILIFIYLFWYVIYIEHDYIYFNKTNEFTILDKQIFTCLVSTKTEVISLPTVYLMIMQRKKI